MLKLIVSRVFGAEGGSAKALQQLAQKKTTASSKLTSVYYDNARDLRCRLDPQRAQEHI